MSETLHSSVWLRARYALTLVFVAWACSVPAFLADGDAHDLLSQCHDSPGSPAYVLPLAWAGLVLGAVAICWGGLQLVTVLRKKSLRFSPGHALLGAVLPLAVIAALFQVGGVQTALKNSHPRPSPCFGSARLDTGIR